MGADVAHQRRHARQGDPDFQAFHHDLYRTVGKGRWWVMEQQPGPVNWAPFNPDPLPWDGATWTWELAHGGGGRMLPLAAGVAQEQMHAGLLRPDSQEAPALCEARETAREITQASEVLRGQSDIGLFFDCEADAMWHIQPTGGVKLFWVGF